MEADPAWAAMSRALVAELEERLAPWLRDGVHHVGSTSIPGLDAKPILDVMAGVETMDAAEDIAKVLAPDGWHYVGPALDQRAWRRFFVKVRNDRRVAHLHVTTASEPRWREQLLFRDRLRASAELRREYAALKRQLVAADPDDREAYTAGKWPFVARVLGV